MASSDRDTMISIHAPYEEKFALLNQRLRWEVADEVASAYLDQANKIHKLVIPRNGFYVRYGKRAIDVVVSASALVITSPVIAGLALMNLIDLGRPLLFSQRRLGKGGGEFVIVKLRTMRNENDEHGRPLLGEHRVTKLGRVIRRSSLDELPNLANILKGDMSLIGPRPLVPEYLERFSHRHRQRLALRPGLECPTLHTLERPMTYHEQFENDCWYVENVSLWTDLKLALRVLQNALDRRQNRSRGESSRGSFMGYDENGQTITTKNIPEWALHMVLRRHGLMANESSEHS